MHYYFDPKYFVKHKNLHAIFDVGCVMHDVQESIFIFFVNFCLYDSTEHIAYFFYLFGDFNGVLVAFQNLIQVAIACKAS